MVSVPRGCRARAYGSVGAFVVFVFFVSVCGLPVAVLGQSGGSCVSDSDCPVDAWLGDRSCDGLTVVETFRDYFCDVPAGGNVSGNGSLNGTCSFSDSVEVREACSSFCCDGACRSVACGEVPSYCDDDDGDGFYEAGPECPVPTDCDDGDASVFPGSDEVCGDGVDQDCDGVDSVCPECVDGTKEGECNEDFELCLHGELVLKCTVCGCHPSRRCYPPLEACLVADHPYFQDGGGEADDEEDILPDSSCVPEWVCGEWGPCDGALQRRTCTDVKSCGSTSNQPVVVRLCQGGTGGESEQNRSEGGGSVESGESAVSFDELLALRSGKGSGGDEGLGRAEGASNGGVLSGRSGGDGGEGVEEEEVARGERGGFSGSVSGWFSSLSWTGVLLAVLVVGLVVVSGVFVVRHRPASTGWAKRRPGEAVREAQLRSLHSLAARIHALQEEGLSRDEVDARLRGEGWHEDVIHLAHEQLEENLKVRAVAELKSVGEGGKGSEKQAGNAQGDEKGDGDLSVPSHPPP
ncbi:hypothetical protein D6783_02715 [Candidatus Woesearchaeota archaeon]|nr:MAG: hypothetical protein D6783_02715 [Candidatus Woesearchaeota archaeon]